VTTINDQSTLAGNFKNKYAKKVIELYGKSAPLVKAIRFEERARTGNTYNQPWDLAFEHGITAAAAGSTPTGSGYTSPVTGDMQNAAIEGAQLFGRSQVSYEAIFRSVMENDRAFEPAADRVVRRLTLSMSHRHEWQILNGREGWGQIGANPSTGATRTLAITGATWAAGAFVGGKGMLLDLYDNSSGAPGVTKQNLGAITVSSVDYVNQTITVALANATDQGADLSNMWIFPQTHSTATEFVGLGKIAANTGSLFGINAANYDLSAGNTFNVNGTLSMQKILEGMAFPAIFGLMESAGKLVVANKGFEVLNSDEAALRHYGATYRPANGENGFEGITFHCQTGQVEIMPHRLCRDSRAHFLVPEESLRLGATELTFGDPTDQDRIIFNVGDSPAKELRGYLNQALFCEVPRHLQLFTGITY
jgi:hypothetical protein